MLSPTPRVGHVPQSRARQRPRTTRPAAPRSHGRGDGRSLAEHGAWPSGRPAGTLIRLYAAWLVAPQAFRVAQIGLIDPAPREQPLRARTSSLASSSLCLRPSC